VSGLSNSRLPPAASTKRLVAWPYLEVLPPLSFLFVFVTFRGVGSAPGDDMGSSERGGRALPVAGWLGVTWHGNTVYAMYMWARSESGQDLATKWNKMEVVTMELINLLAFDQWQERLRFCTQYVRLRPWQGTS
jgi:hypothetical protein